MIHRYRRPGLLVAAVAALAAALLVPSFALAAVANETTLTVRFVDAVTLLPVDRAAVHVTAHQDGAVIDEVDGETDAAGVSVLINLPHETGEGGPVTLDVVAHKNTTFTDDRDRLRRHRHVGRVAARGPGRRRRADRRVHRRRAAGRQLDRVPAGGRAADRRGGRGGRHAGGSGKGDAAPDGQPLECPDGEHRRRRRSGRARWPVR